MSLITKVLKQKCVYWVFDDFDAQGQPVYKDGEELNCRWEDRVEEIVDTDGTKVLSKAQVMVSTDVKVGGVLWLGELGDETYSSEPTRNEGAFEIIQFSKIPNFRVTEYVRTAYL